MTPGLILDLTALTDFSHVEVDAEQINLTRFSPFFPEKRDFFLENDGILTFSDDASRAFRSGAGPRNFKLFHSRGIGLSDDRRPVPIAGGARLSGRVGRYEVGLLEMQTLEDGGAPAENFAVARVRRSVLATSDIGVMVVMNGYAAVTDDPILDGDRSIAAVQFGWRDPVLDFSVMGKHVGGAFAPGAGFVNRTGVNQWFASAGVHAQRPVSWLTEINPYLDVTEYYTPGGALESRELKPGLVVAGSDCGRLSVEYSQRTERLAETNSILGVDLPAGQYDFGATTVRYVANGGRRVSGSVSAISGTFFDGDRRSVSGTLSLRPDEHWYVEGTFQRNRLTLGGEPVDADLIRGRFNFGMIHAPSSRPSSNTIGRRGRSSRMCASI